MRFITHGDKSNRSLMLIHGMANTSTLFDLLLPYLKDYYVIVCELDGHSSMEPGDFISVTDASEKIEEYVTDEMRGRLYGLLGFSLGGTIATEIISRGNIAVERTILDAAFTIRMGIMTYPFKLLFQGSIWCIKNNIPVPKLLVETIMGEGNSGITDTIYKGVTLKSIGNAAISCYTYNIKEGLRDYRNPVVFWRGENEPYPAKSAKLLKKYLPQMKRRIYKGMGHGQLLHEQPEAYAKHLISFIDSNKDEIKEHEVIKETDSMLTDKEVKKLKKKTIRTMGDKKAFRKEMAKRLSDPDCDKIWRESHKMLYRMYKDHYDLSKGMGYGCWWTGMTASFLTGCFLQISRVSGFPGRNIWTGSTTRNSIILSIPASG